MILLLPISRYKVSYRTAEGVPHSQLEDLMVQALAQGADTLEALELTFAIHRRLLIQSLVGLIQEGDVALGRDQTYLLTEDGAALSQGRQLERVRETPVRSTSVVMERLLGLVAPAREVRYVGRRELDELVAPRQVTPRRHDRRLDPAQVRHLVPRGADEWVRSIEDVRLISRDASWLPVQAAREERRIIGVPDRWTRLLTPALLEELPSLPDGVTEAPSAKNADNAWFARRPQARVARWDADEPLRGEATISVTPSDVIVGTHATTTLERVLAHAVEAVAIAAPALSQAALSESESSLVAALRRGVDVHVLAGGADAETQRALEGLRNRLREERLEISVSSQTGRLSTLIWRDTHGWQALPGAIAWLDSLAGGCGIAVSHPVLVASVAEAFAGAWREGPGQSLSSVPDRWSGLAAELEARGQSSETGGTRVRLVLGGEAEQLLAGQPEVIGPRVRREGDRCAIGWWRGPGEGAVALELVGTGAHIAVA